jgi:hypothetical protein
MNKLTLNYIGCDSWDRPVYENENRLYVDVDPRKSRKPDICTKQNNEFDGEPNYHISDDIEIEFIPYRATWNF